MRTFERLGLGRCSSLALLGALVGCGGYDAEYAGEEGAEDTVSSTALAAVEDDDALLVPEFMKDPLIPPELVKIVGYLKEAYPFVSFGFNFLFKGPTLADLLDQATQDIINEVRRLHDKDLESDVRGLIDRYNSIARNPTNETSLMRYGTWLDDSYDTMNDLETVILSSDIRSGYNLVIPLNALVAMHLTMLRGSADVGVKPFDAQTSLDLLIRIKQLNYDFVGHRRTFFGTNMQFAGDTKETSRLWQSDLFAKASGAGRCEVEVFNPDGTSRPSTFSPGEFCPINCDLVTRSCDVPFGPFGTDCPNYWEAETVNCLNAKRTEVSARFDADKVVIATQRALAEIIAVYPDPISQHPGLAALGDAFLAAPTFRAEDAPIAVSSIGSRLDVAYRSTGQQLQHVSFVNHGTGTVTGTSQDFMVGVPSARAVATDRFWSFYSGRATKPTFLDQLNPSPANYYERNGENTQFTGGWRAAPLVVPPQTLGGLIVDSPSLTPSNATFAVVNGTDRGTYYKYFSGSGWSEWGGQSGVKFQSSPVAISREAGGLDYFGVGMDGTVKHGWANPWDAGIETLGGNMGGLAATTWGQGRIDLVGVGADRALWHKHWNGSGWSEWRSLGGMYTSKPSVVSWGPGRLDVFARGTDGALYHAWCDNQGCDNDWWGGEYMGGYLLGDPVATSPGWGKLAIVVRGGNNTLYRKEYDGGWIPSVTGYNSAGSGVDTPSFSGIYRLEVKHSAKCLDVAGISSADGANIQQWPCNGTGAQSFDLQAVGNNLYRLVNTATLKCVDVVDAGTADGTNVQQWTCNGARSQAFSLQPADDGFRLETVASKCVEVARKLGSDGANVQIGTCGITAPQSLSSGWNAHTSQIWKLVRL